MFGDILDNLSPEDLRLSPSIAQLSRDHPLIAATPSNQQILDATKAFYAANQDTVDTSALNSKDVAAQDKSFVSGINGYTTDFQKKSLPSGAATSTNTAIFGDDGSSGGIFGPTLDKVKAKDLFTTISLGVSAEVVFFIGGLGGLGCAWDIAKREGPRGYGYATGELGLKIEADINVQAAIFNLLPSQLDVDIFGLSVGAGVGLALSFSPFFVIDSGKLTILGYAVSVGIGAGGGAAVFGGHLWNFG